MEIRLISDIHLEYRKLPYFVQPPINPYVINVCVLAGDIGHPYVDLYGRLLEDARSKFDYVLVVPGNHEYYRHQDPDQSETTFILNGGQVNHSNDIQWMDQYMETVCQEKDCIFLNRKSVIIPTEKGDIRFLGCTFWSSIPKHVQRIASYQLNDFTKI